MELGECKFLADSIWFYLTPQCPIMQSHKRKTDTHIQAVVQLSNVTKGSTQDKIYTTLFVGNINYMVK